MLCKASTACTERDASGGGQEDQSLRNGLILAERLRTHVERLPFPVSGNDFHVTISVGAAGGPHTQSNWGTLVEAADRSMYRAKQEGRNRVAG